MVDAIETLFPFKLCIVFIVIRFCLNRILSGPTTTVHSPHANQGQIKDHGTQVFVDNATLAHQRRTKL